MLEKLEKIGLSRVEAKVYLALVDLGTSFAGGIIARTKQHRQQVYEALEKLEAKRLVVVSQNHGKKFFQAVHPSQLFALVREQESVLKEVVPILESQFRLPREEVVIYRDVEGYQAALENRVAAAHAGQAVCVIGGTGKEFHELTKNVFEKYFLALKTKRVGIKWIIYKSQLADFKKYFAKYLGGAYKARVLADVQAMPVATIILKDRIQLSLFYPRPTVIEVVNESLAVEYQRYFDLLWRQAGELLS